VAIPSGAIPDSVCVRKVIHEGYSQCNARIPSIIHLEVYHTIFQACPSQPSEPTIPLKAMPPLDSMYCPPAPYLHRHVIICVQHHWRSRWIHRSSFHLGRPQICGRWELHQDSDPHWYVSTSCFLRRGYKHFDSIPQWKGSNQYRSKHLPRASHSAV